ncbi:MAG: acyl--CoA ligase, partial [Catenulispora sp.]|nr:acyl--CoA ligase [Catenulispora sp.]
MRYLHELLDARAASRPGRSAVSGGGHGRAAGPVTYERLRERALQLAREVIRPAAAPGDRVLILAGNHADTVAAFFACSYADTVAVVVHPKIRLFHLRHIARDCDAVLALCDEELATTARAADVPAHVLQEPPQPGPTPGTPSAEEARRSPEEPACLIYTSGSTGMPKGVISPHRQMLFAVGAIGSQLGYAADDTVFSCLPLSFDYGLYQALLCAAAGAHLVLGGDESAGPALARRLEETGATVFPLVPHLAATLVRLMDRSGRAPSRLRLVTNTGAALPGPTVEALRRHLPGLDVRPMYGLTECKRVSVPEPDAWRTRPGSVGRPLPGTACRIADETGRTVPAGSAGELVVSGPHVMPGYWNAPDLTARRFRPDGRGGVELYTGDLCRIDEEGHLYFLGRGDDVYKAGGFRVSTLEVEAAALDIAGVEAAAVLRPDGGHPARLFAVGAVTGDELRAGLAERLEPAKIPPVCVVVDRMPLTPHGKPDRQALGAWYE